MPKIKYRFSLSQEERDDLRSIVTKGKHNSQKVLNALILLNYDEDAPEPRTLGEQEIATVLKVSAMKIHRIKQRFVEEGFDIALNGRERDLGIFAKKSRSQQLQSCGASALCKKVPLSKIDD